MKLGALALLVILSTSQMGCEEERPIFTTGNPPMAPLGAAEGASVNSIVVSDTVAIGKEGNEAAPSSCYLTCTQTCVVEMCDGLSGSELQQCSNDCAEGCRCNCGLPCP